MPVEVTSTLQGIVGSSVNAKTVDLLLKNPLTWEKASYSTVSGVNGRYTPLNRPFASQEPGKNLGTPNGEESRTVVNPGSKGADGVNGTLNREEDDGEFVISTEWPKAVTRPPGLRNVSNTCYMNSTLQALMHVPPLVRYFLGRSHTERCILLYGVPNRR